MLSNLEDSDINENKKTRNLPHCKRKVNIFKKIFTPALTLSGLKSWNLSFFPSARLKITKHHFSSLLVHATLPRSFRKISFSKKIQATVFYSVFLEKKDFPLCRFFRDSDIVVFRNLKAAFSKWKRSSGAGCESDVTYEVIFFRKLWWTARHSRKNSRPVQLTTSRILSTKYMFQMWSHKENCVCLLWLTDRNQINFILQNHCDPDWRFPPPSLQCPHHY